MIRSSAGNARKPTVRCPDCGYETTRPRVEPGMTLKVLSCRACGMDIPVNGGLSPRGGVQHGAIESAVG